MINVDGYKAFKGSMCIHTIQIDFETHTKTEIPVIIHGDWLYKPENECWYVRECNGIESSYPKEMCEILKDETNFGD